MPKDAKEAEEAKARGNALYAQKESEPPHHSTEQRSAQPADRLCIHPGLARYQPRLSGLMSLLILPSLCVCCSLCCCGVCSYEGAVCAYGDGLLLCPADAALLRSVLLNNRAAAHLQLHAYADVIADCSSSLALQSSTKALLRRSTAYEKTGKVSEAISDLQAAIAASSGSPGGASREDEVRLRRLEAEKAAADEKMKTEMLGKLKELGNGLLGKFGLSLDQFQAVKDQHTGSYSISFNKAT